MSMVRLSFSHRSSSVELTLRRMQTQESDDVPNLFTPQDFVDVHERKAAHGIYVLDREKEGYEGVIGGPRYYSMPPLSPSEMFEMMSSSYQIPPPPSQIFCTLPQVPSTYTANGFYGGQEGRVDMPRSLHSTFHETLGNIIPSRNSSNVTPENLYVYETSQILHPHPIRTAQTPSYISAPVIPPHHEPVATSQQTSYSELSANVIFPSEAERVKKVTESSSHDCAATRAASKRPASLNTMGDVPSRRSSSSNSSRSIPPPRLLGWIPPKLSSTSRSPSTPTTKTTKSPRKKIDPKRLSLACLFCRERKIACGRPAPDSPDQTCNQCARRCFECEYPTESRRGQHKRIRKKPLLDAVVEADVKPST
ncbi:hypothetical protein BDQ12DRAFT_729124 [Crucibulum laeve]|uniref:Zn(2)-C6 fungal-type domain-containing protein n=1 Tax=Crucibulum laeve TaxID=68775 RepID=A0A5C3LT02_9AGAR|nr:hypothetical protein BDQ12DRAFT_729124 [Crucibulum laeve]